MQQSAMPLGRDGTDVAQELSGGQQREETETDERGIRQTARCKIGVGRSDYLVKIEDAMTKLATDTADDVPRHVI